MATTRHPPEREEDWGEYPAGGAASAPTNALRPRPRDVVLWSVRRGSEPFVTERGEVLPELHVRFETYGPQSAKRNRAVLVFHALTGSAHLAGVYEETTLKRLSPFERAFGALGWWDALVGPKKPIDTERFYVICANLPGSCYGSTSPLSVNPRTGRRYGPDFPRLTVRDLVRIHLRLLDRLEVEGVTVLGGSLGGMLALEFALMAPERTSKALIIAAPARHGPWARAFNRLAREAIRLDHAFCHGHYPLYHQPQGLALARALAMLSYRSPQSFEGRWGDEPARGETYVLYHGEKFSQRFDANCYLVLSEAMDTHDVTRGRGPLPHVLRQLKMLQLFVGIDSDILYPAWEVRELARFSRGDYAQIESPHGHDAFLIETEQMGQILRDFLS
jgi:homoserine O-acetyltransferase